MKFDRRDPRSYLCHAEFAASLAACVAASPGLVWGARRLRERPRIAAFGHALSGNLKALVDYARLHPELPFDVDYFTMDPREAHRLAGAGQAAVLLTNPRGVRELLGCRCIVTTHGPGALRLLWGLSSRPKFVDVWHGLSYRGYAPDDFRNNGMSRYDAVLVASEQQRELYRTTYGFSDAQLHVTGYARVDALVAAPAKTRARVRAELGFEAQRPLVLYAPTWRVPGDPGELAFGLSFSELAGELGRAAEPLGAHVILRMHMNSALRLGLSRSTAMSILSQRDYPDTNDLLSAVDVVITDWSSIAADCYALRLPVVFLDQTPPSSWRGLTELPRAGWLVRSAGEFSGALAEALRATPDFIAKQQAAAVGYCYGTTLEGSSAERYCDVLAKLARA